MELNSFSELLEKTVEGDDLLFVFDVDLVITMAKDPIFHPLTFKRHYEHLHPLLSELADEQEEMLYSLIAAHPERALVETVFPDVLKGIFAEGHKAIALTAQLATSYNGINTVENRLNELNGFGIDFSSSFPEIPTFDFDNGIRFFGSLPRYSKGVIFSNGLRNAKGKILQEFLKIAAHKPKKIIFVDDLLDNVLSVRNCMLSLGIPCDAYHYKGINNLNIPHIPLHEAKNAWSLSIRNAVTICSGFSG